MQRQGDAWASAHDRRARRRGSGASFVSCVARGETVIHRVPRHENEHAPCNLYCRGDVHVDVIYLAPWLIAQAGTDLLGYLQGAWSRSGYDETSEVLALSEAPEAMTAHAHYPLSYHTRPVMTVPYRIAYRVVQQ